MSSTDNLYHIGIDAGSKTIKVCVNDHTGKTIFTAYKRHRSDIKVTLLELIHDLNWRFKGLRATLAITGSAGIGIANALDLPFVQEVVATTNIVKREYPQADAVIELGGEDAKVIYLTGGLEQRMNSTCAGGTGGFIDSIAYMLGATSREMDGLALSATRTYPIASRCSVFAQTDIRPLMNAGAKRTVLAASALDAVVRQTIGGLACGRPIKGTVIFLGGPNQYISNLVQRFRKALGLTAKTGIKPENAHFFTVRGACLYGTEMANPTIVDTKELEEHLASVDFADESLQRLKPLFENPEEVAAFNERHAKDTFPSARLFDSRGALYAGFDAGSTTIKLVLIDEEGHLVYHDYRNNEGDILRIATNMLADAYAHFPRPYQKPPYTHIAHAVATGYGEELLIAGLGVDSGVVETTAHVQGALQLEPNVSFVLDIGGQDIKAIWVKNGLVQNAVLNEACSSGCGSFLSGTAYSLKIQNEKFSEAAARAKAPVDLGTKCTVFMSSRVKHAQKTGASAEDLAAGCSYSVVKNALYRIIGINNIETLGDKIVVQGGTFRNDSVLRAFELLSGKDVVRPDRAHLMGAIGAAFLARSRAHAAGPDARSTIISEEDLKTFNPKKSTRLCEGCPNQCTLSVVEFENGRTHVSGNKCSKALELYSSKQEIKRPAPNAFAAERALMNRYKSVQAEGDRGSVNVGIMNTLLTYEYVPFWHTLFRELGFSITMPQPAKAPEIAGSSSSGTETIPSESVCYPAKVSHMRLRALSKQGATHVFMPLYQRGSCCTVSTQYANALQDGAAVTEPLAQRMLSPELCGEDPHVFLSDRQSMANLRTVLDGLLAEFGQNLSGDDFQRAVNEGLAEQERFLQGCLKANARVASWLQEDENRHGIVLASRPYHLEEDISHGIDTVLAQLNFGVFSPTAILHEEPAVSCAENVNIWEPSSRMMRMAQYTTKQPRTNMVALQSFGCFYDGVNIEEARLFLEERGIVFAALKIDDIIDTAHIRIRLRTMAENIEQAEAISKRTAATELAVQGHVFALKGFLPLNEEVLQHAQQGSVRAFAHFEMDDIEVARTYTRDFCYSTAAIMGRALRILDALPSLQQLTMPRVCQACVLDSLPRTLERITGRSLAYQWVDQWADNQAPCSDGVAEDAPAVGIIGTAPLCFDAYLNDGIVDIIHSQGFKVALPSCQSLLVDDVHYADQLQAFYDQGIRHVIYLQSFGCLKCHVQARGALHELSQRFPGMQITTLDYDSESSALNRENRILLALAAARDEYHIS